MVIDMFKMEVNMGTKVIQLIAIIIGTVIGCALVGKGYEILLNIVNIIFGERYGKYFIGLLLVFFLYLYLKNKDLKSILKDSLRMNKIILIAIYAILFVIVICKKYL